MSHDSARIVETEGLSLWLGPVSSDALKTRETKAILAATSHAVPLSTPMHLASPSMPCVQPLNDLSLTILAGDRIALSGASGSGKSVLVRTLALLDQAVSGAVRYRGTPVLPAAVPHYRRAVAYLPQRPSLPGDTVRDALQQPFQLAVHRNRRFDESRAIALLAKAGKPEDFLDKTSANLSGGEAQIAALVRTLLLAPEVLLLDEPTAALDPESALAVEALVDHWFYGGGQADLSTGTSDASIAAHPPRAYVWISHHPEQALRIGRTTWRIADGQLTATAAA